MSYKIRPLIGNLNSKDRETVIFAAKELQKYLTLVSDNDFSVIPTEKRDENETGAVYLGINLSKAILSVENADLDDAILIDVNNFTGVITGTNARSVLIAAYRYLKELGFAFIRPGKGGEHYPEELNLKAVSVNEKASYRHRSICIEGSVFQKNLTDIIDWLPKAAMNGYFVQFKLPKVFFDRWYLEDTPYRDKEMLSYDDIKAMVELGEEEMKKRSLMYHTMGHGWTCQAFGVDGISWEEGDEPDPKYNELIALVNGERKLWKNGPLITNLCYSNPKAKQRITDDVLNYCKENPDVSYVHFWLSDGTNNFCECDNCRGTRPSDFYVQLLNEIDEKLTKANLNTKIVFLIYVDLLWKPVCEKLKNSDRFVMMFAPISRSYSKPFDPDSTAQIRPFELNKLEFPADIGENIAYLKDWQQDFKCDSFDFDYHFMWEHYFDFAQYRLAEVLYQDIKNLEPLGLNGLVSCQIQRAFLPTSLCMNVMADTLWNKEVDFDALSDNVLKTEFGDKYAGVKKYLSDLSKYGAVKFVNVREHDDIVTDKNVSDLTTAIQTIDNFMPVIEAEKANSGKQSAWEKLEFHAELYRTMLEYYLEAAKGNGFGDYDHIKDMALKNELRFKDEFDAQYFLQTFGNHVVKRLRSTMPKEFVNV